MTYYKELGSSTHILPYFEVNNTKFKYSDYYGFSVSELPLDLILQESVLQNINKIHKIKSGGIIKLYPNRCYKWHTDSVRGVCVNMLLHHEESFVLFGNNVSEDQFDITRLDYNLGNFYLFNNQCMHTVINFTGTRYMFTLEFEEDKNSLTYENFYE